MSAATTRRKRAADARGIGSKGAARLLLRGTYFFILNGRDSLRSIIEKYYCAAHNIIFTRMVFPDWDIIIIIAVLLLLLPAH